jgi:iron complex outermembrane receptor protein
MKCAVGAILLVVALHLAIPTAHAQRADDNAVTAASDAFGTVVGTQTIGLYNPTNARGFNPSQAENLRIEGLYYDQQPQGANSYLFSGSDMRVGIAAQSYAFPSPSGIADYRLRIPSDTAGASAVFVRGPLKQVAAELDTQYPVLPGSLSIGVNVGAGDDFDFGYALRSTRRAIAILAKVQPSPGTEIVPFFGYIYNKERSETPFVYATGTGPLPLFQEQDLPTQGWTTWDWNQVTGGVIARIALPGAWSLRGGLFRSLEEQATNFNDIFLGLDQYGMSPHIMDVTPAHRSGSYSGDLRLVRSVSEGGHRRELTFAVRGRHVDREYGGDSVAALPEASIYEYPTLPEPALSFSAKSRDVVKHSGFGANYSESWTGIGSLNVGVLRTDYERTISNAGAPSNSQRTSALLPTASFTVNAGKAMLYGSYTRGLEDSAVAPSSATNRGEPPPATLTWQADGGVRISPSQHFQFLVGAFRVHKPFFGLDTTSRYTQIADISTTGIESSATLSTAGGLTVVAGGVWLRPKLGSSGVVPVGPVPRTINVNVDYAPLRWSGWAVSAQWTSLSSRVETSNDAFSLPMLNTFNFGLRYGFRRHGWAATVRLDAANVSNAAGLTISPLYSVMPQLQRNYMLTLTVDL